MKHDNYSSYILSNLLENYYKYALLISTNKDTSSYDRKNIGLLHSHLNLACNQTCIQYYDGGSSASTLVTVSTRPTLLMWWLQEPKQISGSIKHGPWGPTQTVASAVLHEGTLVVSGTLSSHSLGSTRPRYSGTAEPSVRLSANGIVPLPVWFLVASV